MDLTVTGSARTNMKRVLLLSTTATRKSCLWLCISALCLSAVAQQPTSKEWTNKHCKAYEKDYTPLIDKYLSRYTNGIHVSSVLGLKTPQGRSQQIMKGARPVVYIVNNTLHYADPQMSLRQAHGMFSAGFTVYFMPVIERLLSEMKLPDMPIAFNSDDWPTKDEQVGGGPYFGYCNINKITSNLPFPDLFGSTPSSCGHGCTPFTQTDHRKEQAVFLGRPTGWHKGARRAVLMAGLKHPDYIRSGITQYPDEGVVSDKDEQKFGVHPQMPMAEQISQFKYVINVDGWCGSKRLKLLLGSDSAILNLVSMEEEWYSPLLVPGKHYIPVRFDKHNNDLEDETDLVHQIKWAQEHPDDVAKIVQHAKQFHAFYMSQRGEQCFAVQLLEEYHRLLLDPWKLQMMAAGTLASVKL